MSCHDAATSEVVAGGRRVIEWHLIPSDCCKLSAASPPLNHPFELIAAGCHKVLLQRHDTCKPYKIDS